MPTIKALPLTPKQFNSYDLCESFSYVVQRSSSRPKGHQTWCQLKGFIRICMPDMKYLTVFGPKVVN